MILMGFDTIEINLVSEQFTEGNIGTTPTTTQPQHCSWFGHKKDFAHPPIPPDR